MSQPPVDSPTHAAAVNDALVEATVNTEVAEAEAISVDAKLFKVASSVSAQAQEEFSTAESSAAQSGEVALEVVDDDEDDEFVPKGPPNGAEHSKPKEVVRIIKKRAH